MTPEAIPREEYGFEPVRLVDLKSLMGDSSDNIPGVSGVGPKDGNAASAATTARWTAFTRIWTRKSRSRSAKSSSAGREQAYLSYDLATIR